MLSNTAEYALRAVLYLADRGNDELIRVNQIAKALGLPRNYLSKILHELVRGGVLVSSRGKHGGFKLAVPAAELSVLQVVDRFDDTGANRGCLLGIGTCSDNSACRVHHRWKSISDQITAFFTETTVAQLVEDARPASAA